MRAAVVEMRDAVVEMRDAVVEMRAAVVEMRVAVVEMRVAVYMGPMGQLGLMDERLEDWMDGKMKEWRYCFGRMQYAPTKEIASKILNILCFLFFASYPP